MKQASYGTTLTGKEAKRLYFIKPILLMVANLFEPAIVVEVEETMNGCYVNVNGNLDFVLKRKLETGEYRRICIVEARKDDMDKGMAQNLVGMEVVSELDHVETVYDIVTNFKEWTFMKRSDDQILVHEDAVVFGNGIRSEVARVAGKVYSILADDSFKSFVALMPSLSLFRVCVNLIGLALVDAGHQLLLLDFY
ncbi:hypothetical protein Poli38472_012928 [Pythium oligandrum]|uniref:Uncharacterized protein n=1 Tax=Pythium oligandrum TaxID=41045 RepID=A0A8K1FIX5_PYTOL|nr:hypothetical protein Poli38472_012928 [Pythium oligandrum]|eukprot:TMW64306.1 hypothetical protein Poli38472_012928 [Pythium oligandrum]